MSDTEYIPSPGKIRPNQLITTFGPGSIVQMEKDSVMILAIDYWYHTGKFVRKNHPYLSKITKRKEFRMPMIKESNAQNIACISFPRWGYCKICKILQFHKSKPTSKNKGYFKCAEHKFKGDLIPARLVVTCKHGHIDEFPWIEWAHSNKDHPVPICDNPVLKWTGGRNSSSISSYRVTCKTCNATNSLRGATDQTNGINLYDSENNKFYKYECTGESPWIRKKEVCKKSSKSNEKEIAFGIITRATSLYYSKVIKGLIIPELAHPIAKFLASNTGRTKIESWKEAWEDDGVSLSQKELDEKIARKILKNREFEEKGFNLEEVIQIMESRRNTLKLPLHTEQDLKEIEYRDLKRNFSDYKISANDFSSDIVIEDIELDNESTKIFEKAKKITKLTSIEVLRYFSRLEPPGEIFNADKERKRDFCRIQVTSKEETVDGDVIKIKNWLPCVVKIGEGIFITFKKEFLKKFEAKKEIEQRLNQMLENNEDYEEQSHWKTDFQIDKQYIILHSISHLLIKEISHNSGYSEASISERIYSSDNMCGILIYTSSTGDGSLGGLVRQTNILEILKSALKKKQVCSRDPICINEDPKIMKEMNLSVHLRQNGSACFGCIMLPETSCENFNKMLDRKILVDDKIGLPSEIS